MLALLVGIEFFVLFECWLFFVPLAALTDDDDVGAAFCWLFGLLTDCLWSLIAVFGCCVLIGGVVGSNVSLFCFVSGSCDNRKDVDTISESIAWIIAQKATLLSLMNIDHKIRDNMLNLANCREVID